MGLSELRGNIYKGVFQTVKCLFASPRSKHLETISYLAVSMPDVEGKHK